MHSNETEQQQKKTKKSLKQPKRKIYALHED